MTPTEPSPDDLLVSAVLDGHASPEEVARVASDPRLAARLEQFRHAAGAVGGPVPLVDPAVREAHLARARAEARPGATGAAEAPRPVGDLAAARARRRTTGRATTILSIAAAVVLLAAAGAFLVGQLGSGGTSSDEVATATDEGGADEARAADAQDDSASSGGDAPEAATASPPSTTVPGGEAFAPDGGTGIDPSLPSLGTFDDVGGFVARVRGQTVLDPTPEDLATDEACIDDFGVDVVLLGRATVAGDEGLAYLEAARRPDRRLWLVDPGAVTGGTCRPVVPVQVV